MFCSGLREYKGVSAQLAVDWSLACEELEPCVSLLFEAADVAGAKNESPILFLGRVVCFAVVFVSDRASQ